MPPRRSVDPQHLVAAVAQVTSWLDGAADPPASAELAAAVRLSLRTLEQVAPGHTVEVRVPPFAVVQCIAGPRYTRGTPPNVVETDPRTWLELATGRLSWSDATGSGGRAPAAPTGGAGQLTDAAGRSGGAVHGCARVAHGSQALPVHTFPLVRGTRPRDARMHGSLPGNSAPTRHTPRSGATKMFFPGRYPCIRASDRSMCL